MLVGDKLQLGAMVVPPVGGRKLVCAVDAGIVGFAWPDLRIIDDHDTRRTGSVVSRR